MATGYELTGLRPEAQDYKIVPKAVRPILHFIFEEGFPHNISEVHQLSTTASHDMATV